MISPIWLGYSTVLGQRIIMDFGRNVGFKGGLAIWEKEYALNLIFKENKPDVKVGDNNSEIYFESNNLDELYNRLKVTVKLVHSIREQPWGQKCFRVYDPDDHLIEFAESMASVVLRLHSSGLSYKEIAMKSMMPVEFIRMIIEK